MAKKNPYIKIKTVEASARSWFGRPSEMDKTIEKWVNEGWELKSQFKANKKNRYVLTFEYRMSDEEVAAQEKWRKNRYIGFAIFFAVIIIIGIINSSQRETRQTVTKTFEAQNTRTKVALVQATNQQLAVNNTAAATLWTLTFTPLPTDSQTMRSTLSATLPPTATHTPVPSNVVPTRTPSSTRTTIPIITAIVRANQAVNIRQSDSTDSQIIGKLAPQESVQVLDQNDDGSWLRILTASNLEGWVSASLLSTNQTSQEAEAQSTSLPKPAQQNLDTEECRPDLRKLEGFRLDSVDEILGLGLSYDYTPVLNADYWVILWVTDSSVPTNYDEMFTLDMGTITIRNVTVQYGFNPDLFGTPYAHLAFDFIYQGKFYSGEIIDIASEVRSARRVLLEMLKDFVMSLTTC
jgi:uncharacterized protein YgiM (DUF1202 family)